MRPVKPTSNAKTNAAAGPGQSQRDEVVREWRESAYYWQKHHATIRTMFAPVTEALIESAEIREGDAVLDVAGGSGEPSLTIAETVGKSGSVMYTDVAPEMVAAAESEAQRRGVTNVVFKQCPADSLPFASSSFDAVVSRLGAMFFPNPLAALHEMLRATKREGIVALVVWGNCELNPFSSGFTNILARYFEPQPADPNAPSAFRFAEAGALAGILKEAGAIDVKERVLSFHIAAPISLKQFWELRSETSGTLREKLAAVSTSQRDLIAQEAQEAVREFFPNDQMRFPAQMIIVTGRKVQDD
jgi:ubiquinone/menaquinone biosynthesis C-methylase UbiE